MADRPLFTIEAAMEGADVIGNSIADSTAVPALVGKLRLFNETLVPDEGTTLAELEAAELTTLVGYPAGGYSLTDFAAPLKAPVTGAIVSSNLVNVAYASGAALACGGYWIEVGTPPANVVRMVYVYDPARPLAVLGDGWPIVVQMGYGANAPVA